MQVSPRHFDGDRFAPEQQINCPLYRNHRKRFPGAAIEQQDAALQNAHPRHLYSRLSTRLVILPDSFAPIVYHYSAHLPIVA